MTRRAQQMGRRRHYSRGNQMDRQSRETVPRPARWHGQPQRFHGDTRLGGLASVEYSQSLRYFPCQRAYRIRRDQP